MNTHFAAKLLGVSAVGLVLGLAACSSGNDDKRLADDLTPPQRMELMPAPNLAPDVKDMPPAIALAQAKGLKTNVYFNEELQQSIARLAGMEETLGRLQNDLQGSAMAMQRVEMLRQEVDAMNVRLQDMQEKLIYAAPTLAPATDDMTAAPVAPVESAPASDTAMRPTPLMGDMAAPDTAPKTAQISKPVVDEKTPAKAASPVKPAGVDGVADVRIGVHGESVRIVLDVGGKNLGYDASVDSGEKLLTVDLPKTAWKGAKSETLKNNPLIASWTAQDSGDGSVVVFALKSDAKIASQSVLKGNPARIVIDLAK
jgi:hypothetical protein